MKERLVHLLAELVSWSRKIWRKLLEWIAIPYRFGSQVRVQRAFIKIVIEFLTEVGVLVMVFPILDTVIQRGQSNVTRKLLIGSICLSVACILVAGLMAGIISEDNERN